jgi:DNA-binding NarL/FixJ family response regulator
MERTAPRLGVLSRHRLFSELLSKALAGADELEWVLSTANPEQLVAEVSVRHLDLVLIDRATEPHVGSAVFDLERLLRTISSARPECRSVILSANDSRSVVSRLLGEGVAYGFVHAWSVDMEMLVDVLRQVALGRPVSLIGAWADDALDGEESRKLLQLTPRQVEVLGHLGSGHDNATIARLLQITERTVKSHTAALYRHLGLSNRVQLALLAQRHQIRFNTLPIATGPDAHPDANGNANANANANANGASNPEVEADEEIDANDELATGQFTAMTD